MARRPSRLLRLAHWRFLRWSWIPCLVSVLWGCAIDPPEWPSPHVGQENVVSFLQRPDAEIDILFLIDNSPSMATKQTALAQNLPRMIAQVQQLPGGLPDVHIGVVSSDMGAGTQPAGGNWRFLGDRGLLWGNDPAPGAIATVAGGATDGCGLDPGARWIENVETLEGGRRKNYAGELVDVFACLATAVGANGSPYPHVLQALRVALNPQDGVNEANVGFLRPKAYLFIVLIADEDDCSADFDDTIDNGMFQPMLPNETARLRCAARGHVCNGQPIPDYDPATGYMGQGFTASLADCAAKDQLDPSQPDPAYLPLVRVQDAIDWVNRVKARPQEQILVSGVIGWPANDDPNSVRYQIGKDPTAPSPQDTQWDYLPICEHPVDASADGNTFKAYGGLRLKQFIDAYKGGYDENTFSICNQDLTAAMTQFDLFVWDPRRPCIDSPLIDTDPSTPEIDPECQVIEQRQCGTPGQGACLPSGYQEQSIPECRDTQGNRLDPANPQWDSVSDDNRPCWLLDYDRSPAGCPTSPNGARILVLRKEGYVAPPNSLLRIACLTCPRDDQLCSVSHQ